MKPCFLYCLFLTFVFSTCQKIVTDSISFTTICKIGETEINNVNHNRYAGIREPNAIITSGGSTVVVFGPHDMAAKNDRAHQDLICTYSKDEGKTWSQPKRIMDRGMESLLPTSLVYDRINNKVILLVNVIFNAPERNDPLGVQKPCEQFVLFSSDEGETWTEPKSILPEEGRICCFGGGHGIQLSSGAHLGRLIVPGGFSPNGSEQGVFYSDDFGQSWSFQSRALNGNTEATACELPSGKILYNWREQKSTYGARFYTSEDGINISGNRTGIPDVWVGCNNSLLSFDYNGMKGILYVGPLGPENIEKYLVEEQAEKLKTGVEDSRQTARTNGGVFISLDSGMTWKGSCIAPGWTFGYNTVVQFPSGDIGVIFEGIPPEVQDVKNKGWDKKKLGIYLAKFDPDLILSS